MEKRQYNVFGEQLIACSSDPVTGFFRDGHCHTDQSDRGRHSVCAIMTEEFLSFSLERGNDLSTPRPEFHFEGLAPGDKWCLCASRWKEAFDAGVAPKVILEATHERTLDIIALDDLVKHAFRGEIPTS